MKNEKELYCLVESNGDLSLTISDLKTAAEIIQSDMESLSREEQEETQYTITPVWYTNEEYEALPEY